MKHTFLSLAAASVLLLSSAGASALAQGMPGGEGGPDSMRPHGGPAMMERGPGMMEHGMMRPEGGPGFVHRCDDMEAAAASRLAFLQIKLAITPEQQSAWTDFATAVQDSTKLEKGLCETQKAKMEARHKEAQGKEFQSKEAQGKEGHSAKRAPEGGKPVAGGDELPPPPPFEAVPLTERVVEMQKNTAIRAEIASKTGTALLALYAQLTPEQKKTADQLAPALIGGGHGGPRGPM